MFRILQLCILKKYDLMNQAFRKVYTMDYPIYYNFSSGEHYIKRVLSKIFEKDMAFKIKGVNTYKILWF